MYVVGGLLFSDGTRCGLDAAQVAERGDDFLTRTDFRDVMGLVIDARKGAVEPHIPQTFIPGVDDPHINIDAVTGIQLPCIQTG